MYVVPFESWELSCLTFLISPLSLQHSRHVPSTLYRYIFVYVYTYIRVPLEIISKMNKICS